MLFMSRTSQHSELPESRFYFVTRLSDLLFANEIGVQLVECFDTTVRGVGFVCNGKRDFAYSFCLLYT